jgi:NADPH:quinone reductase-like Zn-dependent oxidoreductase
MAPFLRLKVRPLIHRDSLEDLVTINGLIEEGRLRPIVDKSFPLSRVAEAVEFVREGRARGQIVIDVAG